jgi:hypothetical protein
MALFGIVAFSSVAAAAKRDGRLREPGGCAPDMLLIAALMLYPALLVVLAKVLHSGYVFRYGWPGILGIVLALVYLVRFSWAPSAFVVLALLAVFLRQDGADLNKARSAGIVTVDERWARLDQISRSEPGIPVVIGGGSAYLEAAQYSPPSLRARLVQVVDPSVATRLTGVDSLEKSNRLLSEFAPLRVESLASFEAAHKRFILYSGQFTEWLNQYLLEQKYQLRLLSKEDGAAVYIVER